MENEGGENEECILSGIVLKEGESGTDVYSVFPKIGSEQPTSTGVYTVRWKRYLVFFSLKIIFYFHLIN